MNELFEYHKKLNTKKIILVIVITLFLIISVFDIISNFLNNNSASPLSPNEFIPITPVKLVTYLARPFSLPASIAAIFLLHKRCLTSLSTNMRV